MSEETINALCEELTAREKIRTEAADEAADTSPTAKQPDKLSGKQVTAGFIILLSLLLAFFIGMRWIDRSAAKLNPAETVIQTASDGAASTDKINLNTAGLTELKTLYGIGDKKAQAIIDYRKEYGPFTSIDEVKRVEGIGDGIFDAIKDDICV